MWRLRPSSERDQCCVDIWSDRDYKTEKKTKGQLPFKVLFPSLKNCKIFTKWLSYHFLQTNQSTGDLILSSISSLIVSIFALVSADLSRFFILGFLVADFDLTDCFPTLSCSWSWSDSESEASWTLQIWHPDLNINCWAADFFGSLAKSGPVT